MSAALLRQQQVLSSSSLSPLADSTNLSHNSYLSSSRLLSFQGMVGEAALTVVRPVLSMADG